MTNTLQQTFTKSLSFTVGLLVCSLVLTFATEAQAQKPAAKGETTVDQVPRNLLLRIITAEDKRLWDNDLNSLLSDRIAGVRGRAALAAGRIGDERSVPALLSLLLNDNVNEVRAWAAFALGEIESPAAADALVAELKRETVSNEMKGRVIEAIGKIAAALPGTDVARAQSLGAEVLEALKSEHSRAIPDRNVILLGLTATLRAKPPSAGPVISQFLSSPEDRVRADAANVLARLRLKDANPQLRKLLITDRDPIVRANAARVLGATEDKVAFDSLLDRALDDKDPRVRVSAIRSLGALKNESAAQVLTGRVVRLLANAGGDRTANRAKRGIPLTLQSEALEILTTLGNIFAAKGGDRSEKVIGDYGVAFTPRGMMFHLAGRWNIEPEVHIAAARINPADYLDIPEVNPFRRIDKQFPVGFFDNWRRAASEAQGLATVVSLSTEKYGAGISEQRLEAHKIIQKLLDERRLSTIALPDVLTAYASLKPDGLADVLRLHLRHRDVSVRATAAQLLGDSAADKANTQVLIDSLKAELFRAGKDELNDAALAILDSLAKQKSGVANDAIKTALDSSDHLLRRRAVALLKENGAGDYSAKIGAAQTRNRAADYERALSRVGKNVSATVSTTRGAFTIKLFPNDALLTVDNFVKLAKRGYFGGVTVHRVVPNFVIQDGDPRGDGNGGPGYQIRCEINEAPYERGAVGMALSGKDTGGSQWFVTHSPQPHLDGGYTVFGNVVTGMSVVDSIVRGDVIRSIVITEGRRRTVKGKA